MLGVHSAQNADIVPATANVDDMDWNRIYPKLNPKPIPKYSPIPPLTLRLDNDTPIIVNMNDAKAIAYRL